jgi:predicted aspartyl protease
MTRRVCSLLLLGTLMAGVLGPAPEAWAQMYRWTNERGEVHYSEGLDSIPERYRKDAQSLGYQSLPATSPPADSPTRAEGAARIRFTPGKPIMVGARINGGGSVDLLLDTGADVTVINPRALAALGVSNRNALRGGLRGITGKADVLVVLVDSIEVSGAKAGPMQVVSHDAGLGQGDGLLGRDFLDRFTVNIDNAAGIVTLSPR